MTYTVLGRRNKQAICSRILLSISRQQTRRENLLRGVLSDTILLGNTVIDALSAKDKVNDKKFGEKLVRN